MSNKQSVTYEKDLYAWALSNAQLLRAGKFNEVDVEHIVEELEDMGKSERRALESQIKNVLLHLLKWQHQPAFRGTSWKQSIRNGRIATEKILNDSPSLTPKLEEIVISEYPHALADAVDETGLSPDIFPHLSPYSIDQILDSAFLPE